MNTKHLFKLGVALVVLTLVLSAAVFAQTTWYVNSSNGDDLLNNGRGATQTSPGVGPYAKIATALTAAANGDIISIAAGTYGEATVSITKGVTLVSTTFLSSNVVTITSGVTINKSGATIILGQTAAGSLQFNLGTTSTALTLTAGTLNIDAANVTIGSGGTITVTNGAINATPTTTNVNVVYAASTASVTAGPELPASIGSGSLTVNNSGNTVTFPNALSTSGGGIIITAGNASFAGNLTLTKASFANNGSGTVTVGGSISMLGTSTVTTGNISNTSTGTLQLNGAVTFDGLLGNVPGVISNTGAGTLNVAAGASWTVYATSFTGSAVNNSGSGNATVSGVTFTHSTNTSATSTVTATLSNGGTGTLSVGAISVVPATISTTTYTTTVSAQNMSTGTLTFTGVITLGGTLYNASTGKINLAGGTITGIVSNDNGGSVILNASTTFAGGLSNSNAASSVKLGSNTLTISGASPVVTNTGTIISATAATIGTGFLSIAGTGTAQINGGGELPNLTIGSSTVVGGAGNAYGTLTVNTGTFTLNAALDVKGSVVLGGGGITLNTANLTVRGNYTQSAGTFAFGANTFNSYGNVTMTAGTVTPGTGTLAFVSGTAAQTFTPLPNMVLQNLTVNSAAQTVTLGASAIINGNVTITAGQIQLATYNIRMQGVGGTFNNTGGYASSGGGTLIWEAAGAGTVQGAGVFSNMDIRLTTASSVSLASAIKISGNLYLRTGDLDLAGWGLTLDNSIVVPAIYKNTAPSVGAATIKNTGGTGGVVTVTSTYDLSYYGTSNWLSASFGSEWVPAKLRNLTVGTGSSGTSGTACTVQPPAGAVTIAGNLTVNQNQTLDLTNAGTLTASTASSAHSINGTVSNGTLVLSGNSSTLTGFAATNDQASVNALTLSGTSVSVTNLKAITGLLSVTGASATVTMNTTSSALQSVTVNTTNATDAVTINAASTASTFSGNLTVTNGALTLTMGNSTNQTIGGTVGIAAGSLTLGSSLIGTGMTTINNGNLVLGSFNYTQLGSAASPDFTVTGTGTVSGTGTLIFDATAAAIDFMPGASYTVNNIKIIGAGFGVTMDAPGMTVAGSIVHTSGLFTLSSGLTFSGTTYTFTAGSYGGSGLLTITGSPTITAAANMTLSGGLTFNSAGTIMFRSDKETASTPVYRTFTVGGNVIQTAGGVDIGNNTLVFAGASFVRTAGSWTMTTKGNLTLGVAATAFDFTPGGVSSLYYLSMSQITFAGNITLHSSPFTVTGTFTNNGTATFGADNLLVMGDGSTFVVGTGSSIDKLPAFPASNNYSVKYTAAATTSKELPAVVNNLTITSATTLGAPVTVNGTLAVGAALTNTSTNNVTFGAGGVLEMDAGGSLAVPIVPPSSGLLNLVYNGVTATGSNDWPSTANVGSVTFKATTTLSASRTVQGVLTIGGTATANQNLDLTTKVLTVQGDVVFVNGGNLAATGGTAVNFVFSGAANTNLTLDAKKTIASTVAVQINKTSSANTITLSGADLDFASSVAVLYFANGVLVTGGTTNVILKQASSSGQPTQGFDRSGVTGTNESHVYGRVKKFVNNNSANTVDISVVTFPVGALSPTPYYRPMTYYFKTSPQSSINLTVSEVDQSAGGLNGFPIAAGTLTITNYPAFYWYSTSDIPLAPSYQYDLEAQAKGYTDYTNDGIQNIRFVRRDSGSVNNQWILQANQNTSPALIQYDNSTIASNWPLVKVINATGGLTSQGSIFSYSQSDKPPVFTAAPGNTTIAEGATFTGTFAANDPDLNQGTTLSVQATTVPAGAYTFTASTGVFKWVTNFFSAGSKTLTIRATATNSTGTNDYKDTTITITVTDVPRAFTLTKYMPDTTIAARQALAYTYVGASPDTDRVKGAAALKFWVVTPAGATIDSLTGAFSWTPAVADTGANKLVVIKVVDGTNFTLYDTAMVTVSKLKRAPYFTASMAATLSANMGSNVNFTYVAADSDGFALTYAVAKGPGTIGAATGAFNYYVPYNVPGTYVDTVTVTASNGLLSGSATTIITRVYKNVKPFFTAKLSDGTLFVGDTLKFTYAAKDSNGDAMRFYGISYPTGAKVDSVTGAFFWIAASQQTAIYVIRTRVTDNQGGADTVSAQILVQVVQMNVTGAVTYSGGTVPVNGVSVTITRTDITGTPTVLTTNTNGAYTTDPNKLSSGTYAFSFTKTGGHPTVYTNAADALKAALYSVDATTYPLAAIRQLAADVNNDGVVNSADALQIMLRYVGSVTSFAKGDWIFVPTAASKTLTTADFVNNAVAIAVGDVNGDAQAGGAYFAKANGTPSVVAEAAPALKVSMTDVFEVPVRVKAAASFGSMSLAFQYPADAATFVGVRGPEGMVSAANNGMVAVAWFNAENAMNVKENDAVVTLRFKPTANIKDFSLTLDPNSQMTDAKGTVLNGINLEVPAVDGSIPTAFAIGQNYPNPFNPSTTIQYDLPVAGHVTMVVYNMLGQVVDKLVDDQQNPGTYKIRWDASKMSSGVYMYHITVDAGKQTFKEVRRMVLLK